MSERERERESERRCLTHGVVKSQAILAVFLSSKNLLAGIPFIAIVKCICYCALIKINLQWIATQTMTKVVSLFTSFIESTFIDCWFCDAHAFLSYLHFTFAFFHCYTYFCCCMRLVCNEPFCHTKLSRALTRNSNTRSNECFRCIGRLQFFKLHLTIWQPSSRTSTVCYALFHLCFTSIFVSASFIGFLFSLWSIALIRAVRGAANRNSVWKRIDVIEIDRTKV